MAWRDKLRTRMEAVGMSDADVARAAKLNPTFMHAIWAGTEPKVGNLAKIAKAVGMSLGELYESVQTTNLILELSGYAGAGDMWSEGVPRGQARSVPLNVLNQDDLVAITIGTNELSPRYNSGDIVCGGKVAGDNLSNLIGRDCIVLLADGTHAIKYLARGSKKNRYTLKSFLPTKDDIADASVTWAAPIDMVIRGR